MREILTTAEFWTALGAIITGWIGYWAGSKRNTAEAEKIEVDNDKEILNTYKTELAYFSNQLELTRKEISELRDEVNKLVKSSCANIDCKNRKK